MIEAGEQALGQWGWAAALPDRLRLGLGFDAAALAAEVAALPAAAWVSHFVAENFTGDWHVLPLRAPRGAVHPILQITAHPGVSEWDDTAHLAACPAIRRVVTALPCATAAVRLMRLGAGSEIHEHRDADLSPDQGAVRLHLPVLTNPEVDFRVNGTPVTMAPGELWYLRLADPHRVHNRGATPRVHLVIDCAMSDELGALLRAAAAAA